MLYILGQSIKNRRHCSGRNSSEVHQLFLHCWEISFFEVLFKHGFFSSILCDWFTVTHHKKYLLRTCFVQGTGSAFMSSLKDWEEREGFWRPTQGRSYILPRESSVSEESLVWDGRWGSGWGDLGVQHQQHCRGTWATAHGVAADQGVTASLNFPSSFSCLLPTEDI